MALALCSFCESIPDFLAVETLHGTERLPEAVEKLVLVTRNLRKCPQCNAYFEFNYDHDGEFTDGAGQPIGYTDESIERIKPEHLEEVLKEHILQQDLLIHHFSERDDEWAKFTVEEAQKIGRLWLCACTKPVRQIDAPPSAKFLEGVRSLR